MSRYNVLILSPVTMRVDSVMTTGPACTSEFSLKVAQRHAKEFTAKWDKPAYAVPVGAEVVMLLREQIEVPVVRKDKRGYRWITGYYVVDHNGSKIYPPVPRNEAYALARELYGDDCKIIIGD